MEYNKSTIMSEDNKPSVRFIRSDFVLFVLVFFAACLLILLVNYIQVLFNLSAILTQTGSFALLLLFGWFIYLKRLTTYRYNIGTRMFSVDRVVGKKVRDAYAVHLKDITAIHPYEGTPNAKQVHRPFHGNQTQATVLYYKEANDPAALVVMLSPAMRDTLIAQWKAARK